VAFRQSPQSNGGLGFALVDMNQRHASENLKSAEHFRSRPLSQESRERYRSRDSEKSHERIGSAVNRLLGRAQTRPELFRQRQRKLLGAWLSLLEQSHASSVSTWHCVSTEARSQLPTLTHLNPPLSLHFAASKTLRMYRAKRVVELPSIPEQR
jgi:hypothetical protein